ncbi:hypothetical protein HJC22_03915 [Corallococcus exiguus]|uniref:hypothetical protein n=1 Tax=Corallococcus TaxID=83461 RepID=UPI0013156933|nr:MULTISPECIES: hypothetical protein [Corallococcus]NNC14878.1 hypothetical protein [Corallococcus exiguus]
MEQVVTKADRTLGQFDAGQGVGGAQLNDPTLYDELKNLVPDLPKHPWNIHWQD